MGTGHRVCTPGRHLAAPPDGRREPTLLSTQAASGQLQLGPAREPRGTRPAGVWAHLLCGYISLG